MLNECVNLGLVPAAEGADRTAVFPLALQELLHTGIDLFIFFFLEGHLRRSIHDILAFLSREVVGKKKKKCFILGFHFKTSGQNLQSSQMFSF